VGGLDFAIVAMDDDGGVGWSTSFLVSQSSFHHDQSTKSFTHLVHNS